MENLQTRLNSVQDSVLDLIEKDSDDILDQIEYWQLIKEEFLILHAARQRGILRLGLRRVPTLQASETQAKQAIEMILLIQSLASSRYAQENWTRRDLSREMFDAEPQYCFMKGGTHVTVRWDGDKDNQTEYPAWEYIYCQNEAGAWEKLPGYVDYHGLFYNQDHIRIYYRSFDEEAQKYSHSRYWEVIYKNVFVSSVTPPIHTSTRTPSPEKKKPSKRSLETTPASAESGPPEKRRRGRGRGGGGGGRGRGNLRATAQTPEQAATSSTPHRSGGDVADTCPATSRLRSGGRGSGVRGRGGLRGCLPGDVGSVRHTVAKGGRSRVQTLLAEAHDPPLLVIAGAANVLKCLRYRIIKKHHGHFRAISSNFWWAEGEGHGSGSRMLIAFEDPQQRKAFQNRASLPQSVRTFLGNFQSY
uniref:Regulatory protein E2 n=1 Tax=Mops bat papillomavirus TaxID=3141892 RepID=A0AAU7E3M8_9PAPI